jgi:8-oxo-dGTP pyrophosphatase MutT (NUDIX family)
MRLSRNCSRFRVFDGAQPACFAFAICHDENMSKGPRQTGPIAEVAGQKIMSISQPPPAISGGTTLATQVAALCWRMHKGRVDVLLITSRDTGRWVIPKGWPVPGLSLSGSAAREAWEEAGVEGPVLDQPLGQYLYAKITPPAMALPCSVAVFPLRVATLHNRFPERKQRRRKWFAASEAAQLVAESDLRLLLDLVSRSPELLEPIAGPASEIIARPA